MIDLNGRSTAKTTEEALPVADLVSVIIPCYNHARFLRQAIESALAQSYSNFEIIVVDDGSTDDTAEVARSYSMARYVYQENAGRSAARNTGLEHSRGEFVLFLDADDRLLPRAIEKSVLLMHDHPECAFVSGHCRVIDLNGVVVAAPRQRHVGREHYVELLRRGSFIWCPALVLFRRRVFDFAQGFDPALVPVEDYDLYLRITKDFPVYCHDEVVAEYRQYELNSSRDATVMQRVALAAHRAQLHFARGNGRYRKAYESGRHFWQEIYPVQEMVKRIREIVRREVPPNAIVAVASDGKDDLLRLDGRQAWHFPRLPHAGVGDLFAEGASGSLATDAWIEAGMTYEFTLCSGAEELRALAGLLVHGIPATPETKAADLAENAPRQNGVLLTATPNPVPVGSEAGVTTIRWNTGDGSPGRVYVSHAGMYAGAAPRDNDEARNLLERERAEGAQYLLIPAKSFWWSDRYKEFRKYVESRYSAIFQQDNTCSIFDLR